MAPQANGRAKKSKKSTPNGSTNGHLNGYANGHMNGHMNGHANKTQVAPRTSPRKPRRSIMGAIMSILARLVTWYIIITLLFRCPPSLTQLNDASPQICKPYLQGRSYAAPYLDPYYQAYVAPHVEKVKPYTDQFEKQVYRPAATFTKTQYGAYGAPWVNSASKYAEHQYEKSLRPQLQNAKGQLGEQYNVYLGPYVDRVSDAGAPYYEQVKASLDEIYQLSILPAYQASLPHIQSAYSQSHHLSVDVILPYVRASRDATWAFVLRTVWPQVRVLYGDNVEPQLVRISERLGRYRDQQKMESVADAVDAQTSVTYDSTDIAPTFTSSASVALPSPATKSGWGVLDDFFGGDSSTTTGQVETKPTAVQPAEPKLTGDELREKLNQDLRKWQTKFATAADKGAEDLEQRVEEITKRQVENSVNGHGRALVIKLEETADSTIASLKSLIKQTVKSIPEDATEADLESEYKTLASQTREYGLAVKERAQDVRAWKATYDQETDSLVQAAVRSTVEVLEKIHGLGLQEVGMRWAWTDGVEYQDWQNYHKLRSTLNEWQAEVEAVGSRHEGLRTAHEEAKNLEDEAMTIASKMVTELVRLKDVSRWKLWANDWTDDFSNKVVPARVFKAAQQVKENVEGVASQVSGSLQGTSKPVSENVASSVKSVLGEASSQVAEAYESPKKVFGGANAQILAEARQVILDEPLDDDDDEDTYSDKLKDTVAEAGDRAADLSRMISEALLGPSKTTQKMESMTSLASEQYARAVAAASSVLYGTEQPAIESATSVASEKFAQAVTAASYAIYGTPTPTAIIRTVQIQASSRYNDAVRVASEQLENAKSQLSILVSGTPKPAHETMLSYFEQAYSDAVAVASQKLAVAVQYTDSVKSYAAGPTQGYFESVSSIASSRLAAGLSQASAQFSPAQPTGTVADSAKRQYYQAVGLAHARYSEFVAAASDAAYGPQQGTFESLASVASVSAASAASYVSDSAASAASYVSDSAESLASAASASAASAASYVSDSAGSLASQASSGVVGSETPWTESVASQASVNWDALIAKASSQVYGQPTPWMSSVYSQAGAYGAQATAAAAQQYADVQALISELVIGKEPDFTESVMNRFASAYYTGIPAVVSSAQSYAGEQFEAVTDAAADAYASASSVVSSVFTPPAVIEDYLRQASASLDLAVESASIALYGTPKGAAEKASESVASAYSSMQSQVSKQVYGTQDAYDSFSAAALNAQTAISNAIFGTPTAADYVASATSSAGAVYESISSAASANAEYVASVASSNAAAAASAISSAVYGPEQGAMESANSRIAAAVEVANSKIREMYAQASKGAEEAASSAASVAAQATQRVRDEL